MTDQHAADDELDRRLAALGQATSGVAPRADFAARVMSRVLAGDSAQRLGAPGWLLSVSRAARGVLPVASLAAALALAWALRTEEQADALLATTTTDATQERDETDPLGDLDALDALDDLDAAHNDPETAR